MLVIEFGKAEQQTLDSNSLFIRFVGPDFKENLDKIKKFWNRVYLKSSKEWEVPFSCWQEIKELYANTYIQYINEPPKAKAVTDDDILTGLDFNGYNLYDYQLDGVKFGLNHHNFLLLDEQGLGKTLQIITLARYKKQHRNMKHCLIICGLNSLKFNWQREVEKFCKNERAIVLGTKRNTKGKIVPMTIEETKLQIDSCPAEFFWVINIEKIRLSEADEQTGDGVVAHFNKQVELGNLGMVVVDEIHKCFDYNTLIMTDLGYIKIGDIVENKIQCNVCSYNNQNKQLEWQPISNWYKNSTTLTPSVKVRVNNRTVTCTYNHKFYTVNRGWVEASQLTENDEMILNEYVINNLDLFKKDILNIIGYKTANVSSVEYVKSDDIMYDIEVEHNNNYFANGILVHNCKNPQSQQGKGLLAFNNDADRIGMTGTLLVNNPYDLYCPMLFTGLINYKKWVFENKFVVKDDWGKPIGYQNMNELHEILYKSSIRRTKDLLDLPPKIYKQEWLEFTKEEQNVFDAVTGNGNMSILDKIEPPIDMFAKLTRMRQATTTGALLSSKCTVSTKFDRLKDILEEARISGQKVLVFCQFTEALKICKQYCSEYQPKLICGGMGSGVQETIDLHENSKGFSVIFAQEATLGAGFTLSNTEIVVFLTPPWNKATYDQCCDRVHRIGQKKTVTIIDLLIENTYDELVYIKLHGKGAMSDALIDGKITPEIMAKFNSMGIVFQEGQTPDLTKLF